MSRNFKKKSLQLIYLAWGRFQENGAKISKIFNIKIIIGENGDVWPIFIFLIIMVTNVCAHYVEKIKKFTVDFISLEDVFGKMVLKIENILTLRS